MEGRLCCFKCFSWLLPLARPPSEPLPAGALGGAGSPGSAPGAPVVSELELHISMCLPFKFSRCHVFMCMFFFKTKMKTKILEKVKGEYQETILCPSFMRAFCYPEHLCSIILFGKFLDIGDPPDVVGHLLCFCNCCQSSVIFSSETKCILQEKFIIT